MYKSIEELQTMLEKRLQESLSEVLDLGNELVFFHYTSSQFGPCYGLVDRTSQTFFLVPKDSMHQVIQKVQEIEQEGEAK